MCSGAADASAFAAAELGAWSVASGFTALPKSVRPERIASNLKAPEACRLSEAEMELLGELDCGFRYGIGYLPGCFDCPICS